MNRFGNLDDNLTEEELRGNIYAYGQILKVNMVQKLYIHSKLSLPYIYVVFDCICEL